MEAHIKLVHAGVRGEGPTVEGAPVSHRNIWGGDLQVKITWVAMSTHPGDVSGGGKRSPGGIRYCTRSEGNKRGENGRPVGYADRRSKGMVVVGLEGEEPVEETMVTVSEAHL